MGLLCEQEGGERAGQIAEMAARQMRRLRAAAQAEGLELGPGWRVDVKIRKNGTSKGAPVHLLLREQVSLYHQISDAMHCCSRFRNT